MTVRRPCPPTTLLTQTHIIIIDVTVTIQSSHDAEARNRSRCKALCGSAASVRPCIFALFEPLLCAPKNRPRPIPLRVALRCCGGSPFAGSGRGRDSCSFRRGPFGRFRPLASGRSPSATWFFSRFGLAPAFPLARRPRKPLQPRGICRSQPF